MLGNPRKVNRGPAASADNRQAILAAARAVFAQRGYHAPLSAVAKAAGVSQGVFYRHFPTRLELAFAVFDQHWADYEAISADPDPQAFARLWSLIMDKTIDEAAFVEMVVDARRQAVGYDGADRMRALLGPPLARAQDAGLVDPRLTVDDVMLAQRMVFGIVVTAIDPTDVRNQVSRALSALELLPPA
ncbi:TetR/AcrR family transcriptional regulator [Micromonospora sp. WMMD812]|uniref:TetR/AcrR family transcriptional regulator n=1 Tax=Micromonospora sp. WMMD812 TaxID=3015152 RepID=UPI00248CBD04|nr:TetR/AcrR family transcriptional regulator [Micromonospora sp. WMMD812]WBB67570.1 helix-turn-helix domain containing protein [Micromonospora sp. WMMD812]